MRTHRGMTTPDVEGMFLSWLRGEPVPLNFSQLQPAVAESEAELAEDDCTHLGLPRGTTVGHAARTTLVAYSEGVEYRLTTRIAFGSESESLRWWRTNRDNPDRVRLRHVGGGQWSREVAPPCPPELGW
jgi:hypothetical protein